jgi:hypothetical protein
MLNKEEKEFGKEEEVHNTNLVESYFCTHITDLCTTASLISSVLFLLQTFLCADLA